MNKRDKVIYDELVEASARIIAWQGIVDAPLPSIVHTLGSEAVDLRNGWTDFDANLGAPPGTMDLPIVDAVANEVFARSDELRRAFAAKLAAAAALRESNGGAKH